MFQSALITSSVDDKAEADGLSGHGRGAVDQNLQRDRPAVTDHRGRKAFAQSPDRVRTDLDLVVPFGMREDAPARPLAPERVGARPADAGGFPPRSRCAPSLRRHQDAGNDLKRCCRHGAQAPGAARPSAVLPSSRPMARRSVTSSKARRKGRGESGPRKTPRGRSGA